MDFATPTKHFQLRDVGHPCSDESRLDSEMMDRSNRSLNSGDISDPMERLRLLCLAKGAAGVLALGRAFRRMEDYGSKVIYQDEFVKVLHDTGLKISDEESQEIFNTFDKENSGSINMSEFIAAMRPPMVAMRVKIVEQAFEKLDKTHDGNVTMADFKRVYSGQNNKHFENGEMSQEQILQEFLENFENGGLVDGHVTHEEFMDYYAGISASVENDCYFDLAIRLAYKL